MKVAIALACFLLVGGTPPQAETIQLETRNLLDGKIQMLIPTYFGPMSEELIRVKYPMERRPTIVLSNELGTVNIAVNHTTSVMSLKDLDETHRTFERMFRNLYPSATWYRSERTTLNGQECFILELLTPAIDTEIHNIIIVSSLESRMLIIATNLTKELVDKWLPITQKMIESIKFK
jgi:hypothetical protein